MKNNSLIKKIQNTQLGLNGITPVSYIDKIFNSLTKNVVSAQSEGNINTVLSPPQNLEVDLITENELLLTTENNKQLIV